MRTHQSTIRPPVGWGIGLVSRGGTGCNGRGATEGVQQGQKAAVIHILASQDTHCPGGDYRDTNYYGPREVCGQVHE